MNWTNIKMQIAIYLNLAVIWGVFGLIVQFTVNQWLSYFQITEITFLQALSAIVLICLSGWLIKYLIKL